VLRTFRGDLTTQRSLDFPIQILSRQQEQIDSVAVINNGIRVSERLLSLRLLCGSICRGRRNGRGGSTAGAVAGDWFWPNTGALRTQNSDEISQLKDSIFLYSIKKCLARRKNRFSIMFVHRRGRAFP
jgi:hypothetical protein